MGYIEFPNMNFMRAVYFCLGFDGAWINLSAYYRPDIKVGVFLKKVNI